jgi:hypothetical protein
VTSVEVGTTTNIGAIAAANRPAKPFDGEPMTWLRGALRGATTVGATERDHGPVRICIPSMHGSAQ